MTKRTDEYLVSLPVAGFARQELDCGCVTAVYTQQTLEIRAPRIVAGATSRRVPIVGPSAYNFDATGV